MKIHYLAAGLAGLLFLGSLCTCGLCLWYVWSYRQNMVVQTEVLRLSSTAAAVRSLLADSVEYSRRNSAILPLLKEWNLTPRIAPTNTPAPAGDNLRSSNPK